MQATRLHVTPDVTTLYTVSGWFQQNACTRFGINYGTSWIICISRHYTRNLFGESAEITASADGWKRRSISFCMEWQHHSDFQCNNSSGSWFCICGECHVDGCSPPVYDTVNIVVHPSLLWISFLSKFRDVCLLQQNSHNSFDQKNDLFMGSWWQHPLLIPTISCVRATRKLRCFIVHHYPRVVRIR